MCVLQGKDQDKFKHHQLLLFRNKNSKCTLKRIKEIYDNTPYSQRNQSSFISRSSPLPLPPSSSSLRTSYPENEADDGRPRRGHDFGTVGHKVEQSGHDALCCMIKLVTQQ